MANALALVVQAQAQYHQFLSIGLQAPRTSKLFSDREKWGIMGYAGLERTEDNKIPNIWHDMQKEWNATQCKHTLFTALHREGWAQHCYNIVGSTELVDSLHKQWFGELDMLTYKDAHWGISPWR